MGSWFPWVRRRRRQLREKPWPPEWQAIVSRNVPLADRLGDEEREALDGLVQLFLDDKTYEGCGGLEVTDEIRVTIAVQACLLLVGLEVDLPYPDLDVIRVYPSTYVVPVAEREGHTVIDGPSHQLGQSSRRGYVVLAWDAALRGGRKADGQNVVLHEFAHQLDTADGAADGAPVLGDPGLYGPWAKVLGGAYEELLRDVHAERAGPLDPYGATSPAEFFAVATEAFFERPERLRRERPALYAVLSRYYGQDPAGS